MFEVRLIHKRGAENPHIVRVSIPGEGKTLHFYEFSFHMASKMFELGASYYNQYSYDPRSILKFHEQTVKDFEIQPMLPFARWNNPKFEEPKN